MEATANAELRANKVANQSNNTLWDVGPEATEQARASETLAHVFTNTTSVPSGRRAGSGVAGEQWDRSTLATNYAMCALRYCQRREGHAHAKNASRCGD